ncbi:MAG TPA: hypothetical protein VKQ52_10935, partial [Puia sp.]|nr:hypothetical protein [Puia sp.]
METYRMEPGRIPFASFLSTAFDKGDYSTDDVLAFVLPLFRKVLGFHEAGMVAPFDREGALFVHAGVLDIDETLAHAPADALYRVNALFPREPAGPPPSYLPGYRSFEHPAGHHDPQTDIYTLGLILGNMAM